MELIVPTLTYQPNPSFVAMRRAPSPSETSYVTKGVRVQMDGTSGYDAEHHVDHEREAKYA